MEVQELRIGNYIFYEHTNHIVSGIIDDYVYSWWVDNGIPCIEYKENGEKNPYIDIISHYEPIPLTEEWVIGLGFSTKDYKKGYIGIDHKAGGMITDFVLTYPGIIGDFQKDFIWEHSKWKYNTLKYVHELQNLFYVLTGTELKIKL
jgi:hypothetical protein